MKPSYKAIHIAKSLKKANCMSQNLSISMPLPVLTEEKVRPHNKKIKPIAGKGQIETVKILK
jgi:hypothetical protein